LQEDDDDDDWRRRKRRKRKRWSVTAVVSGEKNITNEKQKKDGCITKAAEVDEDDDGNNKSNKIGPTAAEPTAMDAETFNQLVSLGTWDKIVPECTRLALIGKITDGVLGQAYVGPHRV
jgi:hypothetical protein